MKRRHASAACRSQRILSDQNTVTKYRRLPSTFLFICQSLAIAPHFVEFCRDLHFLNGIITHPSLKQNDNFEQVPVDLDVFDLTGEGVDQDGFDIGHRRDFRFVSRL